MGNAAASYLFTVIMPVYNHARYVGQAVASVLAQEHREFEMIIVDDGSTDGSEKIVDELAAGDSRIRVIHQPNAGPRAARNRAVTLANTPWLTYLDSDDLWYPHTLRKYAQYIAAHPDAQFLYGYRDRLDDNGVVTKGKGLHQDRPTGTRELFNRMYLSHLCVCYRRELFLTVGGYDPQLVNADDYDLYLRMSLRARFEPIGAATGLRRRHSECMSEQSGRSRMFEAEVLRRFSDSADRVVLDDELIRKRLSRLYLSAAREYLRGGHYRNSIIAARQAGRHGTGLKLAWTALCARLLRPFDKPDKHPMPRL